jgi:hypothetical protein
MAGVPALVYGELARTSHRIRSGPTPARPRFGKLQGLMRRIVLRLMKPFTVHERIIDEELVRTIAALGDGLAGAHMRIDELARRDGTAARTNGLGGGDASVESADRAVTAARRSAEPRD